MGAGLLLLVQGKLVKSRIVTAAVSSRLLGRDWLLNRELLDATAASLLRTAVFLLVVVLVVCLQLGAADCHYGRLEGKDGSKAQEGITLT
ncbi:hypothetical protein E3N88_32298 [Mikania micrantha]|uniref:Uncharacterized protein n=1 Tax=Mikania micrantha TaxID=192012 RepID=A0A5N6M821_9ASTR|nr:hypothetical protein E3N88_32298 [Mikania micrantha]